MFDLHKVPNFIKVGTHCNFETKSAQFRVKILNFQISCLRIKNLTCSECQIALGIYFIFATKFSWNEGINTCFNVEWVLLSRNVDFFSGYLVFTARYLMFTTGYCSLLVVTARHRSLLLFPTFSMNERKISWS